MYTSRQSDSPKGLWTHTVLTLNPADPSLSTEICTGPLSPPELHYSQMGRAPSSVRCREMPFLGSGGCCSTSSMPAPAESSRSPPGWVRGHRPAGRAFPGKQVSRGPPESRLMRTIRIIIVHGKSKAGGAVSGHLSTAQAGGSQRTIVRMGLLEEALLSGGARWTDLRSAGLFAAATEGRVEGLGHDGRGAGVAVSAGVGRAVTGPADPIRHGQLLEERVEASTIPDWFFSAQQATVISSLAPGTPRSPGNGGLWTPPDHPG